LRRGSSIANGEAARRHAFMADKRTSARDAPSGESETESEAESEADRHLVLRQERGDPRIALRLEGVYARGTQHDRTVMADLDGQHLRVLDAQGTQGSKGNRNLAVLADRDDVHGYPSRSRVFRNPAVDVVG